MAKFDVSPSDHHVAAKDIDVGFATKTLIKELIKDEKVSELHILEFRKSCERMLVGTVSKIQE